MEPINYLTFLGTNIKFCSAEGSNTKISFCIPVLSSFKLEKIFLVYLAKKFGKETTLLLLNTATTVQVPVVISS
jgi:hypothetical protein